MVYVQSIKIKLYTQMTCKFNIEIAFNAVKGKKIALGNT